MLDGWGGAGEILDEEGRVPRGRFFGLAVDAVSGYPVPTGYSP